MRNIIEQKVLNPRIQSMQETFWNMERARKDLEIQFIAQMHRGIEIKYPMEDGWHHVWIFDHSSCHATKADNAS